MAAGLLPTRAHRSTPRAVRTSTPGVTRLERFRDGWRLSVGGQPFVVLGGELRNSTASDLATLEACWPEFAGLNLNTLLVPVSWELVEPREGSSTSHS